MNQGTSLPLLCATVAAFAIGAAPSAFAHVHVVDPAHQGEGQVVANGQNHGPFVAGQSCSGDPAFYGLETAHHGPDAGTPGKADGCYRTTGGVAPGADVENPVFRP
jgi:hypothetical protein